MRRPPRFSAEISPVLACLWLAERADAGTQVYWAHFNGSTIESVPADDSEPPQLLVSGASNPPGVAVDTTHIYWTNADADSIGRAGLDGDEVDEGFIEDVGAFFGLAADSEHLYWGNPEDEAIGRANLDGTSIDNDWMPAGSTDAFGIATTPPEETSTSDKTVKVTDPTSSTLATDSSPPRMASPAAGPPTRASAASRPRS